MLVPAPICDFQPIMDSHHKGMGYTGPVDGSELKIDHNMDTGPLNLGDDWGIGLCLTFCVD